MGLGFRGFRVLGVSGFGFWGLKVAGLGCKVERCRGLVFRDYLEGQGDLVSRLIIPITHIVTLNITSINLLTKSS